MYCRFFFTASVFCLSQGFDGGDCCFCTCISSDNNCGGNFNCIDPDASCVDDDDGDGGTLVVNDDDAATGETCTQRPV